MSEYTIRPLGPETWGAFAALAAKHNGVWGGCWCTWFHTFHAEKEHTAEGNRALKERLVNEGRAHAALVFDGDAAVGQGKQYVRVDYDHEPRTLPAEPLRQQFIDMFGYVRAAAVPDSDELRQSRCLLLFW